MIKYIRKHKKKMIVIVSILIVLVVGSVYGTTLFNSNTVSYDNGTTGLKSRNVQNAIDELYSSVLNGCKPGYSKGEDNGTVYVCNKESSDVVGTIEFDSSDVRYDNSKGLTATTVQGAISELAGLISNCKNNYSKQNETSNSYECTINTLPSTLTVTSAATTNSNAASTSWTVTTGACASWHYVSNYGSASYCNISDICPFFCQSKYGTSTWSCVNSKSRAPSSASLASGPYCWYYFS